MKSEDSSDSGVSRRIAQHLPAFKQAGNRHEKEARKPEDLVEPAVSGTWHYEHRSPVRQDCEIAEAVDSSAAVRVVLARWGIPDAVERELEEAKDVSLATASQPPETRPGKLNRPVNQDQAWPRAGQAGAFGMNTAVQVRA